LTLHLGEQREALTAVTAVLAALAGLFAFWSARIAK
jgi:hypothetical protein